METLDLRALGIGWSFLPELNWRGKKRPSGPIWNELMLSLTGIRARSPVAPPEGWTEGLPKQLPLPILACLLHTVPG